VQPAASTAKGGWRVALRGWESIRREIKTHSRFPGKSRDRLLRAVVAELGERGTPANCGAVWRFSKREGIS
jgi:hypothetical protein